MTDSRIEEARVIVGRLLQLLAGLEAEQHDADRRKEVRDKFIRGLGETMRQAVLRLMQVEEHIQTAQRHAATVLDATLIPLDLSQLLLDVQQVIHDLQYGMPR